VDHESITFTFAVDLFLLLLIGIGPKIALVPFLEITADMDDATKRRVAPKMLTTAATVSVLLLVLGEVLRRLLHFSIGSLSVASGLILLITAVVMVLGSGNPEKLHHRLEGQDPMRLAVFPRAIPYLVNPAGIVAIGRPFIQAGAGRRVGDGDAA
jgi:multiple antibiotic resistance protein